MSDFSSFLLLIIEDLGKFLIYEPICYLTALILLLFVIRFIMVITRN